MKKKSFASILILALVMTTLAGCGKNEGKNDKPPVDTTSETVTEVTTVTETEAQIEAETDTQTETQTEVEDKTDDTTSSDVESGTVSEKKTSGDTTEATTTTVTDVNADEYWADYPLATSDGKKVYIKKTDKYTYKPDGLYRNYDYTTKSSDELYAENKLCLHTSDGENYIMAYISNKAEIDNYSWLPNKSEYTDDNGNVINILHDDNSVVYYGKISEDIYIIVFATHYDEDAKPVTFIVK